MHQTNKRKISYMASNDL